MVGRPDESRQADRDERLGEAVETYLDLAEQGHAPDPEEFVRGYPDLADELRSALDGLVLVQGLVGTAPNGVGRRLPSGHRIAGYRIVRELGRGGMGVVYEAVHVDLDRPVALKVMVASVVPGSRGRVRFLNEAKTAAGLHHTHIVPVFDVGQVGGLCYYAMQRIEGSGLDRVLRSLRRERITGAGSASGRRGLTQTLSVEDGESAASGLCSLPSGTLPGDATASWPAHPRGNSGVARQESPSFIPPRGAEYYRWVARAGSQAADALAYAHRRGVIHRDIKPSNLLVDAKGTVWVADFGLARRMTDPSLTRADGVVGTPRYMSPEQAEGRSVDGRTDVYSVGATIYELLTLRPPFDGQTQAELIRQITGREPAPPRQADHRIPRDLETIVMKAMARNAGDRYETAAELAEDLQRFLATEPVRARRISPLGRFWRFTRRHPAVTAVSAAALALVLSVAAVAYHRVAKERDNALAYQRQLALALGEQREAARGTRLALTKEQLSRAELLRKSTVPNRREAGFELLGAAARLGPDATTRTRLREEALALISLRDVVPRVRELPTGRIRGIAMRQAQGAATLATLSEDAAEVRLWDPASASAPRTLRIEPARATDEEERPPTGPGAQPPGGRGLTLGPSLAFVGSALAVATGEGPGLSWLDTTTGQVKKLSMDGHVARLVLATSDSHYLVTAEEISEEWEGDGPPRPTGFRVWLWDCADMMAPIDLLSEVQFEGGGRAATGATFPRIALEPEGTRLAIGWWGRPEVAIWDLATQRKLTAFDTGLSLTAVALGPNGMVAAAGDGKVLTWDVSAERATPLFGLSEHQGQAFLLRFNSDGSLLAVGGPSTGVQLWEPASNTPVATISTDDRVMDVFFSGPKSLVITGFASTSSWDIVESVGHCDFELESGAIPTSLIFGEDGRLAVPLAEGTPVVLDPGVCPRRISPWNEAAGSELVGAARGRQLLLGTDGVEVFDGLLGASSGRFPWPPLGDGEPDSTRVKLLAKSPDGNHLAFLRSLDRGPRGRGRNEGGPLVGPPRPGGPGVGGGATPGAGPPPGEGPPPGAPGPPSERGRRGESGKREGSPRVEFGPRPEPFSILWWSGEAGPIRIESYPDPSTWSRPMMGPRRGPFQSSLLDPTGSLLYFLDGDRHLARWRREGKALVVAPLPEGSGEATTLALSPDGSLLALGRDAGGVSVVEAATGRPVAEIAAPSGGMVATSSTVAAQNPAENSHRVSALAFAPDGRGLAVGAADGTLTLWSLAPDAGSRVPTRLLEFPGRRGWVVFLAFEPDGRGLAVSDLRFGEPRTIEVWDLERIRATLEPLGLSW